MKILVFSDSHGHYERMLRAVRTHLAVGKIDRIFFLGDGLHDIVKLSNEFPTIPLSYVLGNCDEAFTTSEERASATYEEKVTAGGITFLLMHGHKYDVKYSYDNALFRAQETNSDVVLFGHTHHAEDNVHDTGFGREIRMINPGSVTGFRPSYAVLNVVAGNLVCGFGEL